jgi:uncharacterized protein YlxW (UPF0749 family)
MAESAKRVGSEGTDPPDNLVSFVNTRMQRTARPARLFNVTREMLVWAAVALILGAFFTAQLRTRPIDVPLDADYGRRVSADVVAQLESEQTWLKQQITDLRRQITAHQEQSALDKASFAEINQALRREQSLAGLTDLTGPGLTIVVDDSPLKQLPIGSDPEDYLIHEYYLRDIINALWAGGAEAISLNGERIVPTTSVYCVGSTILVNSTRLSPPYVFYVIGDQQAAIDSLNDEGLLKEFKEHVRVYGLQYKVEQTNEVTVPAFDGILRAKYAQSGAGQ